MNEEIIKDFEKWISEYFDGGVNLKRYNHGFKGYKSQQTHDMYHAYEKGRIAK